MEQKTCGQCKGYFRVNFKRGDPIYHEETKRSCRANLFDLAQVSTMMGLTDDQDPLIESCTHFEPIEEAGIEKLYEEAINAKDEVDSLEKEEKKDLININKKPLICSVCNAKIKKAEWKGSGEKPICNNCDPESPKNKKYEK